MNMELKYWQTHLSDLNTPKLHFVSADPEVVRVLERASSELDFAFFNIDAKDARSTAILLDEFAREMRFPDYFGHNWDAALDLTRDLSWVEAVGYVLLIQNADSLLLLPNGQISILLRVLIATVNYWRYEPSESGEPKQPKAFAVVFSGSDSLLEMLLRNSAEPVCDHRSADGLAHP